MTGFAKRQCIIRGRNVIIEIKTLNSKQVDANVKLPNAYRDKELPIRSMLNRLERGKIDFILTEEQSNDSLSTLNKELALSRYNELKALSDTLGGGFDATALLTTVLQQSDVWAADTDNTLDDESWKTLGDTIAMAIDDVDATRAHEGEIMKADIVIDLIEQKLGEIPQYESQRINTAKERMRSYLADAAIKDVDENRFEQELIYYLEKLDITEEKVRLAKHINYFRDVMDNEPSCGKKLSFIAQEMGREINTTGSKANHVEIQKLVVVMKDELEKIKEQLGNIL